MKKIKLAKKGVMLLNMLMFAMIVVLIIIIIYLGINAPTIKFVGSTQAAVISTFEFSERTFLYIDVSVDLASKIAKKKILSNAGFYGSEFVSLQDQYVCGKVVYPVLNLGMDTTKCTPNYEETLLEAFNLHFDLLLEKYSYIRIRSGDFSSKTLRKGNDMQILVDGISPIQIPFYTRADAYYDDKSAFFNSLEGGCSDVVVYAQQYIGTGYGGTGSCPAELAARGKCTTQCGSFVTNVFTYAISEEAGNSVRGNGRDKCETPGVTAKFNDPDLLEPGDIFASTSPTSQFGHTGIYVGRGRVENLFSGKGSCYREFIPDLTGEPVFIHSIGPVCYSTLTHLTVNQKRSIISYCRIDSCSSASQGGSTP